MNIHRFYKTISPLFRRRRLRWFSSYLHLQPTDRLLDLGGYPDCWPDHTQTHPITLLNLHFSSPPDEGARFTQVVGNACEPPFEDQSFDVVFSNSVIEHLRTWENQQAFAKAARRLGKKLWIQTPAYEFPIEPHFLAPFIHWLPIHLQTTLARNFTGWGWFTRPNSRKVALFLNELRLLQKHEMQLLFPDCAILEEKFLGLTKSYIAVRTG